MIWSGVPTRPLRRPAVGDAVLLQRDPRLQLRALDEVLVGRVRLGRRPDVEDAVKLGAGPPPRCRGRSRTRRRRTSSAAGPASARRPFRSATLAAMTSGASPCITYASAWADDDLLGLRRLAAHVDRAAGGTAWARASRRRAGTAGPWWVTVSSRSSRPTTSSHSCVRAYRASCTSNGAPYCAASSFHQDDTTLSDTRPGAIVSRVDSALAVSDGEW